MNERISNLAGREFCFSFRGEAFSPLTPPLFTKNRRRAVAEHGHGVRHLDPALLVRDARTRARTCGPTRLRRRRRQQVQRLPRARRTADCFPFEHDDHDHARLSLFCSGRRWMDALGREVG